MPRCGTAEPTALHWDVLKREVVDTLQKFNATSTRKCKNKYRQQIKRLHLKITRLPQQAGPDAGIELHSVHAKLGRCILDWLTHKAARTMGRRREFRATAVKAMFARVQTKYGDNIITPMTTPHGQVHGVAQLCYRAEARKTLLNPPKGEDQDHTQQVAGNQRAGRCENN